MKVALALVVGLLASQPAQACHRFQRWRYPWPQQCGTRFVQTARFNSPIKSDDERVTIEITVTPELLETWARQDALEKIRGELK